MKKKFNVASAICLCSFLLIAASHICTAQGLGDKYFGRDSAYKHPVPYMWASGGNQERQLIANFRSTKLWRLIKASGIEQPDSFRLNNFFGFISYIFKNYPEFECLHVYIAAFSEDGSSQVPQGYGKHLTLIFAPAGIHGTADYDYFNIPNNARFDEQHTASFNVNSVQKEWRDNYVEKLMPAILRTIDKNDPNNRIGGQLSDTRCITYCREDLLELVQELKYIHTISANSNEIKFSTDLWANFSAYGSTGNPRSHYKDKNRLFVQFDFTDEKGEVVDLEKTFNFKNRKREYTSSCARSCGAPLGLDTGNLCPPNTNCPK